MEDTAGRMPAAERRAAAPRAVEPFGAALERHGLSLVRGETRALQVNTGLVCNLRCRHCHLEAGPGRVEVMSRETMEAVIGLARRFPFRVADITGGSPEMVPDIAFLVEGLARYASRVMLRSNLTALDGPGGEALLALCRSRRIVLVVSFPSTNPAQVDAQRGAGVSEAAAAMLRRLNAAGYGVAGTGLELDLVSNPAGAFLPPPQAQAERRFRAELLRRWGITFDRLFTFGNVPLGRFREWLADSGNHHRYMRALAGAFNPCTVGGLMCRTQLSVAWDGTLYDCDFNIAAGLPLGGRRIHVADVAAPPPPGSAVAVGDHCYACTAGSGFT